MSEILTTLLVSIYFRYFLWAAVCANTIVLCLSVCKKICYFIKLAPCRIFFFFLSSLCEHCCFASICSQKIRFFCKTGHHVAYFYFFYRVFANTVVLRLFVRKKYGFFVKLATMSHIFIFLSSLCKHCCFVSISSQKIRFFY